MSVDLAKLDKHLETQSYVDGHEPTQADVHLYKALQQPTFPHVARWAAHIKSWEEEHHNLPGSSDAAHTFIVASGSGAAPAAAPAAKADAEEEEEIDLFGDDDEEDDAEAERVKAERVAAYNAKKSNKPKGIAKTMVTLDVKPWDDETDMEKLVEAVVSIKQDGLIWGPPQLIAVGYGIKKLQINATVEDELVSVDELQEKIQEFEDYVQSTDVVAMAKL